MPDCTSSRKAGDQSFRSVLRDPGRFVENVLWSTRRVEDVQIIRRRSCRRPDAEGPEGGCGKRRPQGDLRLFENPEKMSVEEVEEVLEEVRRGGGSRRRRRRKWK